MGGREFQRVNEEHGPRLRFWTPVSCVLVVGANPACCLRRQDWDSGDGQKLGSTVLEMLKAMSVSDRGEPWTFDEGRW